MAFAYVTIEEQNIIDINFELYNLDDYGLQSNSLGLVINRCTAIKEIFLQAANNFDTQQVLIEKQVPRNENAMCIMYSLYTIAITKLEPENVYLFDPKMKFTSIGLNYDTKNKNHKKKSIELAKKLLSKLNNDELMERFLSNSKQDDIADAINQAIVWSYKNKKLTSKQIIELYDL